MIPRVINGLAASEAKSSTCPRALVCDRLLDKAVEWESTDGWDGIPEKRDEKRDDTAPDETAKGRRFFSFLHCLVWP